LVSIAKLCERDSGDGGLVVALVKAGEAARAAAAAATAAATAGVAAGLAVDDEPVFGVAGSARGACCC
jgi:hypothetical protein